MNEIYLKIINYFIAFIQKKKNYHANLKHTHTLFKLNCHLYETTTKKQFNFLIY